MSFCARLSQLPFMLLCSLATALGAVAADPVPGNAGAQMQLGDPSLTAGIPGEGPLTAAEIDEWIKNPGNHVVLEFSLPLGLAAGQGMVRGVDENPLTRAKIELGRQLFFDKRLSSDHTISCASCHQPDHGYAAATRFGIGVDDQQGDVNSPVAYNRILSDVQFWDGRAGSLEEQAKGPIANPIEMGNTHEGAVATVGGIDGYKKQFAAVYPDEGVSIDTIAKSIASFERALVTAPSPFDYAEALRPYADYEEEDFEELEEDDPEQYERYLTLRQSAQAHPMSASAQRGRELFFSEKTNCTACHVGANLTDEKFHNIGIGMRAEEPKAGRYAISENEHERGAFKTPTIRNVASSPPYMHDGSLGTLEAVVEHYEQGGTPHEWLSKDMLKLELTPQDKADLVEFMRACSGSLPTVSRGRLPQN